MTQTVTVISSRAVQSARNAWFRGNLPPFPPAEECGDLRVYFLKDNFKANKKNQSELIVKPKITLYIPICVCFVNRHP